MSLNTRKAYAADWTHFTRWCRLRGHAPMPPAPATIAGYLTDLATPDDTPALAPSTIERRLAGLIWNYAARGMTLDRTAPEIARALASRADHTPARKALITAEDIAAMADTLPFDLRGLRDRAILLLAHAAQLRRTEVVALDARRSDSSTAWITRHPDGLTLHPHTAEIARKTPERHCPVHALDQWLTYARITEGPVFTRTTRDGKASTGVRLNDKHIPRLVKRCVLAAGLRPELPDKDRLALFSARSLRG